MKRYLVLCLLVGCSSAPPRFSPLPRAYVAAPNLKALAPPVFEAPTRTLPPPGTVHRIPTNDIPIRWPVNMPTNYYTQFLIQRSTNYVTWFNYGLATNTNIFINNIGNYTQQYYYRVKGIR